MQAVKLRGKHAQEWTPCNTEDADGYNIYTEYSDGSGPYLNGNGMGDMSPVVVDNMLGFVKERMAISGGGYMRGISQFTMTPMKRVVDAKKQRLEARAADMRSELNKLDTEIRGM